MKVKVLKTFVDIETKKTMAEGDIVEYAPQRAQGLISKGYVAEVVKDIAKEEKPAKPKSKGHRHK